MGAYIGLIPRAAIIRKEESEITINLPIKSEYVYKNIDSSETKSLIEKELKEKSGIRDPF